MSFDSCSCKFLLVSVYSPHCLSPTAHVLGATYAGVRAAESSAQPRFRQGSDDLFFSKGSTWRLGSLESGLFDENPFQKFSEQFSTGII